MATFPLRVWSIWLKFKIAHHRRRLLEQISQLFKANLWRADFWQQQHVPLFTDRQSVIDHYFINQSIELANNTTYTRGAEPLGARFLSISLYLLSASVISSPLLGFSVGNIRSKKSFFSHKDVLDFIQIHIVGVYFQKGFRLHVKFNLKDNLNYT